MLRFIFVSILICLNLILAQTSDHITQNNRYSPPAYDPSKANYLDFNDVSEPLAVCLYKLQYFREHTAGKARNSNIDKLRDIIERGIILLTEDHRLFLADPSLQLERKFFLSRYRDTLKRCSRLEKKFHNQFPKAYGADSYQQEDVSYVGNEKVGLSVETLGVPKLYLPGSRVVLVTHSTSYWDATRSSESGAQKFLSIARRERASSGHFPIAYLHHSWNLSPYGISIHAADFEHDLADLMLLNSGTGEHFIEFETSSSPSHFFLLGGYFSGCLCESLVHVLRYQKTSLELPPLYVHFVMDAIYTIHTQQDILDLGLDPSHLPARQFQEHIVNLELMSSLLKDREKFKLYIDKYFLEELPTCAERVKDFNPSEFSFKAIRNGESLKTPDASQTHRHREVILSFESFGEAASSLRLSH